MGRHERTTSLARGLRTGVFTMLLLFLLGIVIAVGIVPKILGGASLTVLTGSMEPTVEPGDIVISVPRSNYAIGDVVTYQPVSGDPMLVTHRVIGVRETADGRRYITRGDANGADDAPFVAEQVKGAVAYTVPKLGFVREYLGNNTGPIVMVIGLGLLGYGAFALVSGTIEKRSSRTGLSAPAAAGPTDSTSRRTRS